MLTEKRRHSDSIAPTKDLLIAVQRLFRAGLALSVIAIDDTSPKGRGFGIVESFISSPKALPLGELARKRLRGQGRCQTALTLR